jgi:hypothetical protein
MGSFTKAPQTAACAAEQVTQEAGPSEFRTTFEILKRYSAMLED